jgi:hypothetical protein
MSMPGLLVAEHGIEGSKHGAHHSGERELGRLGVSEQPAIEGFAGRVALDCGHGSHVEDAPDGAAPALDGAFLLLSTAVPGMRREPGEAWSCALMVIKTLGRTDSSATIISYMGLLMVPLSLGPALLVWQWPAAHEWGWLLAIGVLGDLGSSA